MSDEELVKLTSYEHAHEAHVARNAIESAGLYAALNGEHSGNALSYVGSAIGGVKLYVKKKDEVRARQILNEAQQDDAPTIPAWICQECDEEVDAGFEICWCCETAYDATASQQR